MFTMETFVVRVWLGDEPAAQGGQLHGLVKDVSSGSTDPFRNSAELVQIINRAVDTFSAQGRMEELDVEAAPFPAPSGCLLECRQDLPRTPQSVEWWERTSGVRGSTPLARLGIWSTWGPRPGTLKR
jgi:hypothetical protein